MTRGRGDGRPGRKTRGDGGFLEREGEESGGVVKKAEDGEVGRRCEGGEDPAPDYFGFEKGQGGQASGERDEEQGNEEATVLSRPGVPVGEQGGRLDGSGVALSTDVIPGVATPSVATPGVEEAVAKVDRPDRKKEGQRGSPWDERVRRPADPRSGEAPGPSHCRERCIEAEAGREKEKAGERRLDKRRIDRTFPP